MKLNWFISETSIHELGEVGVSRHTTYKVQKKPSWINNQSIIDIENHIFISFEVGNYFAFYFSEKGKKR